MHLSSTPPLPEWENCPFIEQRGYAQCLRFGCKLEREGLDVHCLIFIFSNLQGMLLQSLLSVVVQTFPKPCQDIKVFKWYSKSNLIPTLLSILPCISQHGYNVNTVTFRYMSFLDCFCQKERSWWDLCKTLFIWSYYSYMYLNVKVFTLHPWWCWGKTGSRVYKGNWTWVFSVT